MTGVKSSFVTFKTAIMLEKLGFDHYWKDEFKGHRYLQDGEFYHEFSVPLHYQGFKYLAPTQELALVWLREKGYDTVVEVVHKPVVGNKIDRLYYINQYGPEGNVIEGPTRAFLIREEAVEASIQTILEYIKSK